MIRRLAFLASTLPAAVERTGRCPIDTRIVHDVDARKENGRIVFVRRKDEVDGVLSVPIRDAIKKWTSRPADESWGKVLSIDIVDGRMAVSKVEMLYRGHIYIDLLSLYKINGDWKIVNKTFVRRS